MASTQQTFSEHDDGNADAEKNEPSSQYHGIKQLSLKDSRRITSMQVYPSVASVIKELIENALDAGSKTIDIVLEHYGLDAITVVDDGCGIPPQDAALLGNQGATSKINEYKDLERVSTYGFRGEALHALHQVAGEVTVITRTASEHCARRFSLKNTGGSTVPTPAARGKCGTTLTVSKLYSKTPVRRTHAKANKSKLAHEVRELIITYCLAMPSVRFSLKARSPMDKQLELTKPPMSLKEAIRACFGKFRKLADAMSQISVTEGLVHVDGLVPLNDTASMSSGTRVYIFVNKRPALMKRFRRSLRSLWQPIIGDRFPWMVLNLTVPRDCYDVNMDKSKEIQMLDEKSESDLLSAMKSCLDEIVQNSDSQKVDSKEDVEPNVVELKTVVDIGNAKANTNSCYQSKPSSPIVSGHSVSIAGSAASNAIEDGFRLRRQLETSSLSPSNKDKWGTVHSPSKRMRLSRPPASIDDKQKPDPLDSLDPPFSDISWSMGRIPGLSNGAKVLQPEVHGSNQFHSQSPPKRRNRQLTSTFKAKKSNTSASLRDRLVTLDSIAIKQSTQRDSTEDVDEKEDLVHKSTGDCDTASNLPTSNETNIIGTVEYDENSIREFVEYELDRNVGIQSTSSDYRIIGACTPAITVNSAWVVEIGGELYVFNSALAHKMTTMNRLVNTFKVPMERYPIPRIMNIDDILTVIKRIKLDPSTGGNCSKIIESSIVLNGYDARIIYVTETGKYRIELLGGPMPGKISGYRASEFRHVLAALCARSEADCSVYRPKLVLEHLQREAERLNQVFTEISSYDRKRSGYKIDPLVKEALHVSKHVSDANSPLIPLDYNLARKSGNKI